MQRSFFLIVVVGCFLCPTNPLLADVNLGRETLRDIKCFSVSVERLDDDEIRDGISKSQLQTDIELRLRKEGITVVDHDDTTYFYAPYLYLNCRLIKTENCGYVYNILLQLKQWVELSYGTQRSFCCATTWGIGKIAIVSTEEMPRHIRDNVADAVDEFINDYLAENPKTTTEGK